MKEISHVVRLAVLLMTLGSGTASALFINELHYDNAGTDVGEGVEIAGTAGLDLSGYGLLFYNGTTGNVYRNVALKGVLGDQQSGYGTIFFAILGLQNGAPDGVALIGPDGAVVQFLSYEGAFMATSGAAMGSVSTDIGIFEDGTGPDGASLQLTGTGAVYSDFVWVVSESSYGQTNANQSFATTPIPLPATLPLLLSAAAGLAVLRRH